MGSKLARIANTFTFRLALVYVGLFSLSVILLFAFIYTFGMNYLQAQIRDSIRLQYTYLLDEYRQSGSAGIETRIRELIAGDDVGNEIYLLTNTKSEKLAGNLTEWPKEPVVEGKFEKEGQWVHFTVEGMRNNPHSVEIRAIAIPLSKWRFLLVGQNLQGNSRLEKTVVQTFWASIFVMLAMALFGAIVMTRSVMRRINVINRSAATIMDGHLSVRIPFTPGGDEFDELSSNLNRMLDKIETLLQSLSEFANNIAHDLRSPLNRIVTRLDAGLRTLESDNPAHKLLAKNIQDMQELIGTFNSILRISELETHAERPFEPCDLQAIISTLVEFYEPYAAEKHIALASSIDAPLIVSGEKNLLTQALANLIDNALKFTPEHGHIVIFGEENERIDIVVADSGPGIPQEYRKKVFEKFFRLEQSRHTRGNGLGLSLVAAIARIHDAIISLEDNHPGLRVRLSFPPSSPT
ncbi:MAG: HAMP domain-containing histidine kinase [Pseudomonadota bacterium]|nr:HAMP domain-containing histidine kinase [Pseudomonadota bacterium]